jgi:hypothetical protein
MALASLDAYWMRYWLANYQVPRSSTQFEQWVLGRAGRLVHLLFAASGSGWQLGQWPVASGLLTKDQRASSKSNSEQEGKGMGMGIYHTCTYS